MNTERVVTSRGKARLAAVRAGLGDASAVGIEALYDELERFDCG
jgi:hypothetical protein